MKADYIFSTFSYNVADNFLTSVNISLALDKFYANKLTNIDPKLNFSIMFIAYTKEGFCINISPLQILDKRDIPKLTKVFNLYWSYKSNAYKEFKLDKLVFRYMFMDSDITSSFIKYPTITDKNEKLAIQFFSVLPRNRLIEFWGEEVVINGDGTFLINTKSFSYLIRQYYNEHHVSLIYQNKEVLNFCDIYNPLDNEHTFIRYIHNYELYYCKGNHHIIKQAKIPKHTLSINLNKFYWFM